MFVWLEVSYALLLKLFWGGDDTCVVGFALYRFVSHIQNSVGG
jgi:hypothetical protein